MTQRFQKDVRFIPYNCTDQIKVDNLSQMVLITKEKRSHSREFQEASLESSDTTLVYM